MSGTSFLFEQKKRGGCLYVKKINEFGAAATKYIKLLTYASDKESKKFAILSDQMVTIHDEINTKSGYSYEKLVEITRKHYEKLDIK